MTTFTKIAVTVPIGTYTVVERVRRRLGKSRSAVVALALEEWIRGLDMTDADQRYADGYSRIPEAIDEITAVAAQATSHWGPWDPEALSSSADALGRRRARKPPKRSGR